MDANNEREKYERIRPECVRKIKNEAITNTKLHKHRKQEWKKKRLPKSFRIIEETMCLCGKGDETTDHTLYA